MASRAAVAVGSSAGSFGVLSGETCRRACGSGGGGPSPSGFWFKGNLASAWTPDRYTGAEVSGLINSAHMRKAHIEVALAQRPFDTGKGEAAFDEFFRRAAAILGVGHFVLGSPLVALLMQEAVGAATIAVKEIDAGMIAVDGERRVTVGGCNRCRPNRGRRIVADIVPGVFLGRGRAGSQTNEQDQAPHPCHAFYSGATVTLMPSSASLQTIWQERRELGSTANAISSISVSPSERGGNFSSQPPFT